MGVSEFLWYATEYIFYLCVIAEFFKTIVYPWFKTKKQEDEGLQNTFATGINMVGDIIKTVNGQPVNN